MGHCNLTVSTNHFVGTLPCGADSLRSGPIDVIMSSSADDGMFGYRRNNIRQGYTIDVGEMVRKRPRPQSC